MFLVNGLKSQYKECSTHLNDHERAVEIITELIGGLHIKYANERAARMLIGSLKELLYDYNHHSYGPNAWCFDIDCIEHRRGRGVVAVIERKVTGRDINNTRKYVMKQIADTFGVDAWLVNYDLKLTLFNVYHLEDDLTWKHVGDMDSVEIGEWHNAL